MGKDTCWARVWLQNQRVELGPKGQVQEIQDVESPNPRQQLTGLEARLRRQKKKSKQ